MWDNDKVVSFILGGLVGVLLMSVTHGIGQHMRSGEAARELAESNLKWEQQVDKAYELGFKAGALETLQIVDALTNQKKREN